MVGYDNCGGNVFQSLINVLGTNESTPEVPQICFKVPSRGTLLYSDWSITNRTNTIPNHNINL